MINVLYLIGPSNSGKDYLKNLMIKKFGFIPIVPFTTRPKREGEVDGVDYHFFDSLSDINFKEDDITEMRSYTMMNDDHRSTKSVHYGVSISSELDETKDYIVCGTLESYGNLQKVVIDDFNQRYSEGRRQTFPSVKIIPIFIRTDDDARYDKALKRSEKTGEDIFEIERRFNTDRIDFSFENRINYPELFEIYNSYDANMDDSVASVINNIYQIHKFPDRKERNVIFINDPTIKLGDKKYIASDAISKYKKE